jgi:hypothetical protein
VLTWKVSATKSNRFLFQLAVSTPLTVEIDFGLLPTPAAQEGFNTVSGRPYLTETGSVRCKNQDGTSSRLGLEGVVKSGLLPTPQAAEGDKLTGLENQNSLTKMARKQTGETSRLNPRFVLEMMGFPSDWTELEP